MSSIMLIFFATLLAGIPVAFALGLVGMYYLVTTGVAPSTMTSLLFSNLNSSNFLAVPFFILAAEIMNRCGAIKRLIYMFDAFIGHTKGGLPLVAVVSTAFFSAICGSSVATAAAIGSVLIPDMIKKGYNKFFVVGLIASSGGLGILIPPSIPFVIYGTIAEQSIGDLFFAGMIIGIALAACLGAAAWIYSARSGVPTKPRASWKDRIATLKPTWGVLMMPVLVLGGIYGGIFTPMEASAFSCIYALILALFYKTRLRDLLPMLTDAAAMATVILIILACSQLFAYVLTSERVPHTVFTYITGLGLSKNMLLLAVMIFYIIAGMFLEILSIIIITVPIMLPIMTIFHVDPIHFGVLLVINMELAVITPPIGLNLFVISAFSGVPVLSVFRGTILFALVILGFLAFLTFTPGMTHLFQLLRL